MKDLLSKQKHLFRSIYCEGCKQKKPCGTLTNWDSEGKSYCCPCQFQIEQEKSQAYNSYEEVLASKQIEREKRLRQLELLRNYLGCKRCGSKEVDAYGLFEENRLVCQPCLMKKAGGSSSPTSFTEESKWYKKRWKIELEEWLDNYGCLPVNAECARKWVKDKKHLEKCDCLEREAKGHYLLVSNSIKEKREKLKECQCEESEKVRVGSDDYAWCERCEGTIKVANKKRVVKNRNDVKFWGVESEWKILCLRCIGKEFYKEMEGWQRKKWREYRRRGYV